MTSGEMEMGAPNVAAMMKRTPASKVLLLVLLLLAMLIPGGMLQHVIADRQSYQAEAERDYQTSWGPEQMVAGPMLVVPYASANGQTNGILRITPSRLNVTTTLDPERRRRGFFQATVYIAKIGFSGQFLLTPSAFEALPSGAELQWPKASIVMSATSLAGSESDTQLSWNGRMFEFDDQVADGVATCRMPGVIAAHPGLGAAPAPDVPIPFETSLSLRGTQSLSVLPLAHRTEMSAASFWPSPRFFGGSLPSRYTLAEDGFRANWTSVKNGPVGLSPPCGVDFESEAGKLGAIGIALPEKVPVYRMVERSAKYVILFLTLAFVTYFLFETVAGLRIHLVQYGLLGLSLSLFGLLLISLAEPLGFAMAYALASLAIVMQASFYTWSVTGRFRLAGLFATILGGLFGFLYILLSLDAYSLLAGSAGLFVLLSAVMAATRRIDWSGVRASGRVGA
jgi:inner membrane protein